MKKEHGNKGRKLLCIEGYHDKPKEENGLIGDIVELQKYLGKLRKKAKITGDEMSKLIGYSRVVVYWFEAGEKWTKEGNVRYVNVDMVEKYCEVLKLKLSYLALPLEG